MSLYYARLSKEAVPQISRVGVLWEPTNPGVAAVYDQARQDAPRLGLAIQSFAVRKRGDFESVFEAMARNRPDALLVLTTPLTVRYESQIAEFALKHRLPTMGTKGLVDAGGMISYGTVGFTDDFRRAAHYVARILKGAQPAELPVDQPTRFRLIINLKTARLIGLTMPPALLLRVDAVIE